jgi:ADP-heptose:LPS heptosyltransferase
MDRTIVILHAGGLGDLFLAVPALRTLRIRHPGHRLVLCAHEEASAFLQATGLLDEWTGIEGAGCAALFGGYQLEHSVLRDWLTRCDLAVAWTKDDAGTLSAALRNSGAAKVVAGSPFCSSLKRLHQSDRFLETLGLPPAEGSMVPRLSVPADLREQAETYLRARGLSFDRPVALVHPGSGSRHKCVKPDVIMRLLEGLLEEGLQPVILEGPAERAIMDDLMSLDPPRLGLLPLLRNLTISQVAGVLSQAELFVGHDSGVSHLSALLGVPTVALFGPTDPQRWAPRGPAVIVMQGSPCRCVSWDVVSRCEEKPCLEFSPNTILATCRTARSAV